MPPGTPIGRLCDKLSQVSAVEAASPNYITATPFDLETGLIDTSMVRMPEVLAYEPGDPSVLLGLIDSGIAGDHEEFPGVFRAAAGIRMPAGLGGAVRIIPMRALGAAQLPEKDQPVGLGAISDLDMAMKRAIDLGAKVINASFGTEDRALHPSSPRPHRDVVDYAVARGCILIAASGNNGAETRYWPAAYPEVIAVGAVSAGGRPAAFSTRGPHVALCAPGERILTADLTGYQYATGTSFAAPFVSATAALLVSRAARRAVPLTGTAVKDIIVRSAQPFAREAPAQGFGAGILDAAAALALLDAGFPSHRNGRGSHVA